MFMSTKLFFRKSIVEIRIRDRGNGNRSYVTCITLTLKDDPLAAFVRKIQIGIIENINFRLFVYLLVLVLFCLVCLLGSYTKWRWYEDIDFWNPPWKGILTKAELVCIMSYSTSNDTYKWQGSRVHWLYLLLQGIFTKVIVNATICHLKYKDFHR